MILLLSHSSSVKSVASNGSRSSWGGQVKFLWAKANLFITEIKGGLVLKNSSNIRKDEHMNVVVVLERLFLLGLINEYEYSKALTIANRISS